MSKRFKQLFSPIKIGDVTVPNRIVFPSHLTDLAEDNLPSERQAYYYAERARGGVAWSSQKNSRSTPRIVPMKS